MNSSVGFKPSNISLKLYHHHIQKITPTEIPEGRVTSACQQMLKWQKSG